MSFKSKRYRDALAKIDLNKIYSLDEGLD